MRDTQYKRCVAIAALASLLLLPSAGIANGPAATADRLTVPIEPSASGGAPAGWDLKEWKGKAQFEVVDTEAGKTIHLRSSSTSSAIYKDIEFDIRRYPYLNWKWKVVSIPKGADVRNKSTDDQAAQVYVIFPRFPAIVNSRLVGYIWDTGAPAGSAVTSTKTSNTRYIVIKSDSDGLGQWFTEKRNVYEDYKKLFGEEPPKVGRVSVMIDSDDTKTTAESYIGDIYFSKQ